MDMNELKIDVPNRKYEGMHTNPTMNDIRVTHIKSGVVIEIPLEFARTQSRNLKAAITMLESVIPNSGISGN